MYQRNVLKSISILYTAALWQLLLPFFIPTPIWPVDANEISLNETLVVDPKLLKALQIFDAERPTLISGRSYVCVPLFRVFNVELRQLELAADESLAVSGDHAALGQWQLAKAVPLQPQNASRSKWYLRLWICASQRFYYRYLTYSTNSQGVRVLRRWEGQQVARMLQTYEMYRPPGLDVFGEAYAREVGGGPQLERGWLRDEYIVELKFVWPQQLYMLGQAADAKYRLQLAPLQLADEARIEVSRYAYNRSAFRQQPAEGVRYKAGVIVIFRISQPIGVDTALRLTISDGQQRPLGEAYILPVQLRGSRGILQLPIYAPQRAMHLGELTLPYLVVQPLEAPPLSAASNLRASFQRYWPSNWPTMDVAAPSSPHTIERLLSVLALKGDMAQLDIQLTRDYVPVLWSGFGFYTAPTDHRSAHRLDLRYVLIRQLSFAELRASSVFLPRNWRLQEFDVLNVKNASASQRLFPTLAESYQALPKTLGLLVHIQWPQLLASGQLESTQTLNKNIYLDRIIETTARHGCGRPLIFASSDADVCTMLRLKQHAFPVLLLSQGQSAQWPAFFDLRTRSYLQSLNYAESSEILGTATHVDNLLASVPSQQQLVNLALDLSQVLFVWGVRELQRLEQLRALDASGLIYEHMEHVGPGEWKRAPFFQASQLLELFGAQCVAIGNSTTVPGVKPPKPTIWPKLR